LAIPREQEHGGISFPMCNLEMRKEPQKKKKKNETKRKKKKKKKRKE
jgi:hypothetical protein